MGLARTTELANGKEIAGPDPLIVMAEELCSRLIIEVAQNKYMCSFILRVQDSFEVPIKL